MQCKKYNIAQVTNILDNFHYEKLNAINRCFLQGKWMPHISNLSPIQDLSFAHSLPFGDFDLHTLASRDQCLVACFKMTMGPPNIMTF